LKRTVFLLAAAILLFNMKAFAYDEKAVIEDLMKKVEYLEKRVAELESKLTNHDEKIAKQDAEIKETKEAYIKHEPGEGISVEPAGLNIEAGATFVTQTAIDPNTAGGDNEVADACYTVDIGIEKGFSDWGLAFLRLEGGGGGGLDGDEITAFSGVNAKAGDSNEHVDITEVWYEQHLFDEALTIRGGKLKGDDYFDQNGIANDDCTQFLASAFKHSSAIEFPDGSPYGLWAGAAPLEWLEVGGGIFDDDADWEDVFEDIFSYTQVNFKPNLLGREGNYRTYFWFDDSKHTKWADEGTDTQGNFGFGTSCDQRLTDYLTAFGRFGWEDPDVSTVEWAWSAGFQLDGTLWKRKDDHLGCAIGMDIPGDDYGDAGNPDDAEGHVEAYYNFHVNECLSISPDYQLVWNTNGEDDSPINVIGIRGQVDF